MADKKRILYVGDSRKRAEQLLAHGDDSVEVVAVQNPMRALARFAKSDFDGIYVASEHFQEALQLGRLLQTEQILEGMPDGVVLLDSENTILWANDRIRQWSDQEHVIGKGFYAVSQIGPP